MPSSTNTIQTHQFNWNAWVEWMCKMKCYENLNSEVFGIWENHWNGRFQSFYNGTITCGYVECPETYTELLTEWTINLNNEVIPQMQAHNFVSSCSVQNNVYVKGSRRYELSNHLGNVLAVVSDRKIESDEDYFYAGTGSGYRYENGFYLEDPNGEYKQKSGPDGVISSYSAEVISANDYYAFGSLMPGRSFSGGEYKFGFNGKEKDNEVKGEGGQQDYGMRIYDSRLGRFNSLDPEAKSYPFQSGYCFAANLPILFIDFDGRGPRYPDIAKALTNQLLLLGFNEGNSGANHFTVIKTDKDITVQVSTTINGKLINSSFNFSIQTNDQVEGFNILTGFGVDFYDAAITVNDSWIERQKLWLAKQDNTARNGTSFEQTMLLVDAWSFMLTAFESKLLFQGGKWTFGKFFLATDVLFSVNDLSSRLFADKSALQKLGISDKDLKKLETINDLGNFVTSATDLVKSAMEHCSDKELVAGFGKSLLDGLTGLKSLIEVLEKHKVQEK